MDLVASGAAASTQRAQRLRAQPIQIGNEHLLTHLLRTAADVNSVFGGECAQQPLPHHGSRQTVNCDLSLPSGP
jgi:hypothetical protein